ncbi:AraC family transcriptional regulator [Actinoplanes sp. RD1]|uniref:AraC family transcriptional regulator n=1 Tax=Actinoplanes sp. RD1 TaxID=3064538 RepID=UPI0027416499|nr:AraC family transcriptional regulator [Actinoplanes sp. RD1]
MDPLEDVLALAGASSYVSAGMTAGGRWAVRFEPPAGVKFNSVRRGTCQVHVDGTEPIVLREDDAFLLTQPRGFTLASATGVPPVPAKLIFQEPAAHAGVGDEVEVIGGGFTFNERGRTLLLPNLPPILHVPGDAPEAATVRWVLQRIGAELARGDVGATVVAEHLAMVMFVEVLRLHLRSGRTAGWLAGLADPVVAATLRAMHTRPEHPWTVAELARTARVSRSTLAGRFKDLVGTSPLDYLTGWRIELAAQRLTGTDDTLSTIARAVGYGSESALSTAFKRVTGRSPRDYRRQ